MGHSRTGTRNPKLVYSSVQFSSVQSLNRVQLFATPWIAARQASLFITICRSSLRLMSIESVMPSSHLILGHPIWKGLSLFSFISVWFHLSFLRGIAWLPLHLVFVWFWNLYAFVISDISVIKEESLLLFPSYASTWGSSTSIFFFYTFLTPSCNEGELFCLVCLRGVVEIAVLSSHFTTLSRSPCLWPGCIICSHSQGSAT